MLPETFHTRDGDLHRQLHFARKIMPYRADARQFQEARRVSNKRPRKRWRANRQNRHKGLLHSRSQRERAPPCPTTFPSPSRPGATEPRPGIAERDRHHRAALRPDLELLAGRQGQLSRSTARPVTSSREVFPGHRRRSPAPSRAFLGRAVRYLAAEAGIRQFLDIGTGLPTVDNTHEVAQRVAPECPDRLRRQRPAGAGARPRPARPAPPRAPPTTSTPTCATPTTILEAAAGRPWTSPGRSALMLMAILGHIADDDEAAAIVRPAAGRPALGQLPGDRRRHQRRPRRRSSTRR